MTESGTASYDWLGSRPASSGTAAVTAARLRNNNPADFVVGVRIKHPQFGIGTIVSLKEDVADIAFTGENKGIKRLNVKIAPIEKIA